LNPEPYTVTTVPPLMLPLGGDSHEIWSVRGGTGAGQSIGGRAEKMRRRKARQEGGSPRSGARRPGRSSGSSRDARTHTRRFLEVLADAVAALRESAARGQQARREKHREPADDASGHAGRSHC
jgi:hypothetical protein